MTYSIDGCAVFVIIVAVVFLIAVIGTVLDLVTVELGGDWIRIGRVD